MSGTPYNPNVDDLDVQLKTNDGLINITTYYSSTGDFRGFIEYEKVQKGTSTTAVNLSKMEYEAEKITTGQNKDSVNKVITKEIFYQSDTGGGDPVTTTFTNTFHSGTAEIEKITTNLPNIPTNENGVAFPQNDTTVQEFDIQR